MKRQAALVTFFVLALALAAAARPGAPSSLPDELTWPGVAIGATRADVEKALGHPKETETHGDGATSLIFESGNPNYPNEVTVGQDGRVIHAARVTDKHRKPLARLVELLGKPERVTYTLYDMSFRVQIYAKRGYVAITDSANAVIEEQYFPAADIARFMKRYGERFPERNPYKE